MECPARTTTLLPATASSASTIFAVTGAAATLSVTTRRANIVIVRITRSFVCDPRRNYKFARTALHYPDPDPSWERHILFGATPAPPSIAATTTQQGQQLHLRILIMWKLFVVRDDEVTIYYLHIWLIGWTNIDMRDICVNTACVACHGLVQQTTSVIMCMCAVVYDCGVFEHYDDDVACNLYGCDCDDHNNANYAGDGDAASDVNHYHVDYDRDGDDANDFDADCDSDDDNDDNVGDDDYDPIDYASAHYDGDVIAPKTDKLRQ